MSDWDGSPNKRASFSLFNRIRFIEARTCKLKQTLKACTAKPQESPQQQFCPSTHLDIAKTPIQIAGCPNTERCRSQLSAIALEDLKKRQNEGCQGRTVQSLQTKQAVDEGKLEHSQRKIEERREKERQERRLLRWRVQAERQQGRAKLSQFEANRMGAGRGTGVHGEVQLKGGELRRELMQQENTSLGQFEQELSWRGQLVRRIRQAIVM